ncbi:hydroxypyruvate reductase [Lycorma delicatula]|uniref:hydroxypyruvate reductase n=1 Tax=Lycorma delicatula TaxID=130591 RepID=UPI003F50E872
MALHLNRVLISDAVDDACVTLLRDNGVTVDCKYKLPKDQLLQEIKSYDGLIVRSDTKVTADVINAGSSLRVVGRAGTGVDNIDINAATRKGVIVLNTPGGNSISACELTCTLIMCLARNIAQGCQSLKEGRWDRKLYTGSELSGKTLGIIGLGRIGREVAKRMQAFGMTTVGFDPFLTPAGAQEFDVELLDLNDLYPRADYITIHTPLIPQTKNLINATTLSKCKKGVKVVNVARGGIIDEAALLEALKSGQCGGAALDVFSEEPPKNPVTLELIAHPKIIVTPHLGASTNEAQTRVAVEVAEQFISLKNPQSRFNLTGVVNAPILTASQNPANAPWIDLAGSLGRLAAKIAATEDLSSVNVTVTSSGNGLEHMNFLSTAALVGMLTGRTKNGLNLINAPTLARESGLKVNQTHLPGEDKSVIITVKANNFQHSVQGTVQADGNVYLTRIDDAQFSPGVPLTTNILIFQGTDANSDFPKIIGEINSKGLIVSNIAIAAGKKIWFAVQTNGHQSGRNISPIPGVQVF